MTRQEAEQILIHYDDLVWQQDNHITCGMISEALNLATDALNPWHKASEELPPVDTEVVCKMKGVLHTEHFICKWDGKYWWTWNDCGQGTGGWFGLTMWWEVVEWKEI